MFIWITEIYSIFAEPPPPPPPASGLNPTSGHAKLTSPGRTAIVKKPGGTTLSRSKTCVRSDFWKLHLEKENDHIEKETITSITSKTKRSHRSHRFIENSLTGAICISSCKSFRQRKWGTPCCFTSLTFSERTSIVSHERELNEDTRERHLLHAPSLIFLLLRRRSSHDKYQSEERIFERKNRNIRGLGEKKMANPDWFIGFSGTRRNKHNFNDCGQVDRLDLTYTKDIWTNTNIIE